ncbi:hypothetical protein ACGF13_27015 [Kitasatospora sp. NPDC048286]|uniref:hypothetical protein n=1 Tax=Kitasatospora sp. NPDC048286 TaxID=3364047 RepID=UPI003724079A
MRLIEWDREFRIWAYGFSYSRLLLRSAPRFDGDERIEVLFSNVHHMSISADMSSLSIDRIETPEESREFGIALPPAPKELFVLNSGAGYVIATHCQWNVDHEWLDAPSHFSPFRAVK